MKTRTPSRRTTLRSAFAALAAALVAGCGEPTELVALDIPPLGGASLWVGSTMNLFPYAVYSDGSSRFVGEETDWVASPTTVATVVPVTGYGGRVTGVAPGWVAVTARFQGVEKTVTIEVR